MATFKRFEEIEVWKFAREMVKQVYALTNQTGFVRDRALRDQIRRSTVSIMANIAEGFCRGGNREFVQFLAIAKGSVAESQCHLYVAVDQGYITQGQFQDAYRQLDRIAAALHSFMVYLQRSPIAGIKFKAAKSQIGNKAK
ncbi:MAG: four helix bundle protein [Candidatus Edwardsbacteria bacterium]|jgi:four helix bundle protein|nr:four helix bundle protein [Candidatus Edwardsbacteria bacterium]